MRIPGPGARGPGATCRSPVAVRRSPRSGDRCRGTGRTDGGAPGGEDSRPESAQSGGPGEAGATLVPLSGRHPPPRRGPPRGSSGGVAPPKTRTSRPMPRYARAETRSRGTCPRWIPAVIAPGHPSGRRGAPLGSGHPASPVPSLRSSLSSQTPARGLVALPYPPGALPCQPGAGAYRGSRGRLRGLTQRATHSRSRPCMRG